MLNPIKANADLKSFRCLYRLRRGLIWFWVLATGLLFCGALPTWGDIELADAPLFTQINPPPTNLMILQDDSGSMTFEILVRGGYDGQLRNPDRSSTEGFCYVFDDLGDGYTLSGAWRQMGEEGRQYWRSQFYETNVVYYNPAVYYGPWESYGATSFPDARVDTDLQDKPLVHPLQSKTLDLDKRALKIGPLNIPWAHYFVRAANGTVYLVIMDGKDEQNKYYTFTTDGGTAPNDKILTLTEVDPPADIQRDYADDRPNFANWFTYHRRREFVAKAAIARVLKDADLKDVRVGIVGINDKIIVPLKPVRAVIDGLFEDETDVLLESLYDYRSSGGTPLKQGLETVGKYYQANDGNLQGVKGDVPYPADGGACQQAFTIVVTDGYYSDQQHTFEGNTDGSSATPYGDWGGGSQPYTDKYKDTLADTAMFFYARDLLPGLDNQVPTNKWDGADHQHMVTFAVAFGVSGTLNPEDYEDDRTSPHYLKYITKKDAPREYGDYVVWPEVTGDRQAQSIDDLWHATVNGRGVFVNAGQPQKLVEGLQQIIKDIQSRQPTSAASVTVNGDWLFGKIGPDVLIFQGSYSYIDHQWQGDVKAYEIDQVTGAVGDVKWSVAEKLQAKAWNARNILTFDGHNSGLTFAYDELTTEQKDRLGSDPENLVNFIRGQDPGGSGNRDNMLGDIVHASPVFMDGVVYAGANDGMLHAFNAKPQTAPSDPEPGEELFGYVPDLVFDHLKELADPNYDHRFYVDLAPTLQAGEALLGLNGQQTILVGGLGKGAKGYYALDVTDPRSMTKNQVLWEFPQKSTAEADRDDMGYSYSKPVVVRSYSPTFPWVVIFGNGYNSATGRSALFILDAASGTVVRKIEAGAGPDNGLSSPIAVDINHDDVVDFVYAGDLKGNLWKFDLLSDNPLGWTVAFTAGGKPAALFSATDPDGNPQPITARPDVMFHPEKHGLMVSFGTGKLLASYDLALTQIQTLYGIWDYGDTVFQAGAGWSADDDQEFVGAFLTRSEAADVRKLSNPLLTEKVKLLKQTAYDVEVDSGADKITVRILTEHTPVWDTRSDPDGGGQLPDPSDSNVNDVGWYLDLDVYPGERVVSDVLIRDGILLAIGFIPAQSRCGSGGDSVFMELNAFTGGSLAAIQFDVHDDGKVDEDDLVEIEIDGKIVKLPPSGKKLPGLIQPPAIIKLNERIENKYFSSSSGGIVEVAEKAAKTGIAYWMEIRR